MMKKAQPLPPVRHAVLLGWKLLMALCVTVCLWAILRFHFQADDNSYASASFSGAGSFIHRITFAGRPKVAFLFLARSNLPLDFLWDSFFENADERSFSIYIHSAPGFVFNESTSRSRFFYNRQLSNSIKVAWGGLSMIEAERLLLATSLEDPSNQRFILVSESCVPLYNFSYIYKYLMASPKSFVDSFLDLKENRYNKRMSPFIPKAKWRKGSQWITLVRSHAEFIVNDDVIFPIFQKYCMLQQPINGSKGKLYILQRLQKQPNCIPDEHYVATLFAMSALESQLERRTLTYTVWNRSTMKMPKKTSHPLTFTYASAGPQRIKEIKAIDHIKYETENRMERCRNNSTNVPCFLFGRKFSRGAAMRFLGEGPFETSKLLDKP